MIDAAALRQAVATTWPHLVIHSLPATCSTQQVVAEQVAAGATVPRLVVADQQTAGIGRHGHGFVSPAGGVYFTLALPAWPSPLLTPAAGVAMQRAIHQVTGLQPTLKWVNDVLVANRKVCGILATRVAGHGQAIDLIGCGVNLVAPANVPPADAVPVGGLFPRQPAATVATALVAAWLTELATLQAQPATIMPHYRRHAAWLNQRVRVQPGRTPIEGTLIGFTATGGLQLQTATGTMTVTTGSLRRIAPA